jgi:hypothetical protein
VRILVFLALLLAGLAGASASAASAPVVRDARADEILQQSAWARENALTATSCTGTGPATGAGARRAHASFRCKVLAAGKVAVVDATPLGPEWLRIRRIVEGKVGRDPGLGAIPQGEPTLESFWAGSGLVKSAWAKAHGVATAFCYGVGRFDHYSTDGWLFHAYSCATYDGAHKRGPQVLAISNSDRTVDVVRTVTR